MVIIGLSTNRDTAQGADCMPRDYALSVLRAGGLPLILPMIPMEQPNYGEVMDRILETVDGLVFTGGPGLDPETYGEARLPACGIPVPERDKADLELFQRAIASGKPFLGICRGLQVCNAALGGTLYQDIASQVPGALEHRQAGKGAAHPADFKKGSLLSKVMGEGRAWVTSRHHQSIARLAPGLVLSAESPDGVAEAVEFEDGRPAICVQWHPENLTANDPRHLALFEWLVREAGKKG